MVRSTVATGLTTTNASLEQLFTSIGPGRYPGVVGLALVEVVGNSALGSFERQVIADPPLGQPLAQGFTLTPSGDRPDYCLTRLVAARRSTIDPAVAQPQEHRRRPRRPAQSGFRLLRSSAFNPLLQAAAATGSPEVGEIVPLLVRSCPVRSGTKNSDVKQSGRGRDPALPGRGRHHHQCERQAAVIGWAAGLFDPDQVTAPVLQGVSGLSSRSPTTIPRRHLDDRPGGDASRHDVTQTVGFPRRTLVGRDRLPAEAASPTVQALGLLDIGLIVRCCSFSCSPGSPEPGAGARMAPRPPRSSSGTGACTTN